VVRDMPQTNFNMQGCGGRRRTSMLGALRGVEQQERTWQGQRKSTSTPLPSFLIAW
jgi:hypothetical protein